MNASARFLPLGASHLWTNILVIQQPTEASNSRHCRHPRSSLLKLLWHQGFHLGPFLLVKMMSTLAFGSRNRDKPIRINIYIYILYIYILYIYYIYIYYIYIRYIHIIAPWFSNNPTVYIRILSCFHLPSELTTGTSSSSIFRPSSRPRIVTFLCTSVPPKSSSGSGLTTTNSSTFIREKYGKHSHRKSVPHGFSHVPKWSYLSWGQHTTKHAAFWAFFSKCPGPTGLVWLRQLLSETFLLGFFDNLWELHAGPGPNLGRHGRHQKTKKNIHSRLTNIPLYPMYLPMNINREIEDMNEII